MAERDQTSPRYDLGDQVRLDLRAGEIRARTIEAEPRYDVMLRGGEMRVGVPEADIKPLSEDGNRFDARGPKTENDENILR